MANPQTTRFEKQDYAPPPIDGDFYRIASVLNESERALLKRVREFTEGVIAPVIEDYWNRDAFPFEIIPRMAEVGIGGVGYQGYGAAGGSWLLNGFVSMELARVDSSVATFWGVHTWLSAGSIYLCGDEAQKQRWLPAMMRFEKTGSFGLTEPLVGSATSGGASCSRTISGDSWPTRRRSTPTKGPEK
jgi:glutaryl-CoA dehydrogenase